MKLTTFILLALFSINVNAAGKSAYINSKLLLEKSPQAIAANDRLQKQFGDRDQSLRKLAQDIQKMEQTFKNDSAIMSDEQKKKAEDNIIQNKRRFQFEQQSLKEDLQAKQRELLQELQVSIKDVIQAYGKANGYDFIFTDSSIAYASDAVNITEEIIKELEK
ncbi:MAG: OmpH family outer membrane protein [Gammaproteobacteria bacterium]